MRILVTGVAGFIGFFLARQLSILGHEVVGLDNLNAYYDVKLKKDRLAILGQEKNIRFVHADLADDAVMDALFANEKFTHVVNLAAQAGVRYSLQQPRSYIRSNLVGFGNILEGCRHNGVQHLVYASSSSVYGLNSCQPYSEHHAVNHPVSLYAASKKSNELMAHAYSHLFDLPCTGLRFFTVYGPWGRPDMALHLFTTAILEGRPIDVFNEGRMRRDFTYIDDIIEGIIRTMERPPTGNTAWNSAVPDPASSCAPWRVYNIGNSDTVELGEFIETLEEALGKKAVKRLLPMQPGDVQSTYAEVADLMRDTGFVPSTPLKVGIAHFVEWYKDYYTTRC